MCGGGGARMKRDEFAIGPLPGALLTLTTERAAMQQELNKEQET
jgi:hypothetical protein